MIAPAVLERHASECIFRLRFLPRWALGNSGAAIHLGPFQRQVRKLGRQITPRHGTISHMSSVDGRQAIPCSTLTKPSGAMTKNVVALHPRCERFEFLPMMPTAFITRLVAKNAPSELLPRDWQIGRLARAA